MEGVGGFAKCSEVHLLKPVKKKKRLPSQPEKPTTPEKPKVETNR